MELLWKAPHRRVRFLVALGLAGIGLASANAANAYAGTGMFVPDSINQTEPPCPIDYSYSGTLPGAGALTNFQDQSGCTASSGPYEIVPGGSSVSANFSAGNQVSLSGQVQIRLFSFLNCYYSLSGATGPWVNTSPAVFDAVGDLFISPAPPVSSPLCPNPIQEVAIVGTLP